MNALVSELFGLEDQVAVVTGASGVLGGEIARGLAAAGARVGLLARRREPLEALARSLGDSAVVLEADVLDAAQLERARATVLDRWGRIDVLVNAAGGKRGESEHDLRLSLSRATRRSTRQRACGLVVD